tara:strand:+ start:94 stop:480 length:387 start_codon:yes stop_codon:yes gene_type:complete
MKYLSDYMEEKQTALFNKTGTIFAFSDKQFEEQKVKGKQYSRLAQGMVTEKGNEIEVIEGLDKIYRDSVKQDMKENGKDKVILRELLNHEAFYVGNIEETIHKLEDYPITEDDISQIFQKNWSKYSDY